MSDQDKVRDKYPNAEAEENEPLKELGQEADYTSEWWRIKSQGGLAFFELGAGVTEDEAWADAARRLDARPGG